MSDSCKPYYTNDPSLRWYQNSFLLILLHDNALIIIRNLGILLILLYTYHQIPNIVKINFYKTHFLE